MTLARRDLLAGAALAAASAAAPAITMERYGLIGRIKAVPGKRAELLAILSDGAGSMPGCLSYVVAEDLTDAHAIWVTEVWVSKDAHAASLKLPRVRAAIARGRPLIAGFETIGETRNAVGHGLVQA